MHLGAALQGVVHGALQRARERGVAVRFACNEAMDRLTSGPPPPRTDPAVVAGLGITTVAFPGVPDLMHHKYVVRDRTAVWTGSTNWSDDSWSREENVIVTVASPELAAAYADDFEQLWRSRDVSRGGHVSTLPITVDGATVRPWFSPGQATGMVHRIAAAIGHASARVRVASPVITSGPILGTLVELAEDRKVDLGVVIDGTQVHQVLRQWAHQRGWKRGLLERIAHDERTSAKRSTPWGIGTVHDFMHAKVTVADETVFAGSYNLSRSGESNAEDVLEIADRSLADHLVEFIDGVRRRYPRF